MTENIPCQPVKSFPFLFYLQSFPELLTPHTLLSHTHQPHFSSSPCTNLNSTHSSMPSSGRPAKLSSDEIRTEIAPQDRTKIAPITLIAPIVLRSHPRITPRLHQSLSFPIWCRRPPLILIYFLLSLPSSPNLIGFDEFFLVGFCFFCIYLLRNGIIYLFGS